jgi:hypothetical protein
MQKIKIVLIDHLKIHSPCETLPLFGLVLLIYVVK